MAILIQSLQTMCPMAISILSIPAPSLTIAEVEEHAHTPSGYISTISINLTCMLSGNLNTCAIDKYTNILGGDYHTVSIW